MIWAAIFLAGLTVLLITVVQNMQLKRKYNENLDFAHANLNFAITRVEEVEKPIFALISKQYGDRFVSLIENRKITDGMPSELLLLSWGKPGEIKSGYYKGLKSESWFYDSFTNRLGNIKYRTEVYIENNKIVGWKDLA